MADKAFDSRVLEVLKSQGRSVAWFARQLGISHSLVYRWADGSRTPTDTHRRRAAEVLGIPESLLFLAVELPAGNKQIPAAKEVAS